MNMHIYPYFTKSWLRFAHSEHRRKDNLPACLRFGNNYIYLYFLSKNCCLFMNGMVKLHSKFGSSWLHIQKCFSWANSCPKYELVYDADMFADSAFHTWNALFFSQCLHMYMCVYLCGGCGGLSGKWIWKHSQRDIKFDPKGEHL